MEKKNLKGIFISHCPIWCNAMRHYDCRIEAGQKDQKPDFIIVDLDTVPFKQIQKEIDKNPYIKIYGMTGSIDKKRKYKDRLDGLFHKDISIVSVLNIIMDAPPLTPADYDPYEIQLLQALRKGFSDKKIAYEQDIPLSTVKYYLRRLYKKMKVENRVQAALAVPKIIV